MLSSDDEVAQGTQYRKKVEDDELQASGLEQFRPEGTREYDYLDEQLNAVAHKPEFKLSDLNDEHEEPMREKDVQPSFKQDEEADFNSLENRLKNIRKNLNFDQCMDEINN